MNEKTHFYLITVFLLLVCPVYAAFQPDASVRYYFKTLDNNDGLSQNTVNSIIQDRQGFMWFGTKDGLNRYDGLSFHVFRKENASLGNNCVTALHEDKEGNIWIGTDAGVYIYSPVVESFVHFQTKSEQGTVIDRVVTSIKSDKNGDIWISTGDQGLFYYDLRTHTLTNYLYDVQKAKAIADVTNFEFDNNGTCWVSFYADNLYYTRDLFQTLVPFTDNKGRTPYKNDIINKIVTGPDQNLYIGSANGGLKKIDLSTMELHDLLFVDENGANIYVRGIAHYTNDEIWAGTESGLFIYDRKTEAVTHLKSSGGDPYSLSDNAIYAMCKDREGGMWIGSYFGGINYYPRQYTYFEKFYPRDYNYDALGRRVREFCEGNDGTLWIGTEDEGVFNYDPEKGKIKPFIHPAIYRNVHALCMDDHYLWVGTFSKGLNRVDLRNNTVKNYRSGISDTSLNSNDIFAVYRSKSGDLWIGTTSGLHLYNRIQDNFIRVPEVKNIFVYAINEDNNGNVWFATYANGVYRYNTTEDKWTHYVHQSNSSKSIPSDIVTSIFVDSKERIWFTTQGGGFCRFNLSDETFTTYDSSLGFPSNVIHKIVEDDNGLFWITTNEGLVRFNPETHELRVFTTANGLLSNQFNYQSGYKDKAGKIYLGSINGFISFDPSTFVDNTFVPPVVITDFFVFNKRVTPQQEESPLQKSITLSDKVTLKSDQNSFTLRVAALSYQAPQMNKLFYCLEGYDKEWYPVSQSSSITYSNLPYGTYTFMVKGSNSDGIWNQRPTILHVQILPPFYLSVWAYILYFILFVAAVVFIVRYFKIRNARKNQHMMDKFEQKKERELYTAKIDFFTNVAHEIRTPLTLIKTPLENILKEKEVNPDVKEDLVIMNQNANRLLDLTNQLLDFRKTESQGFKLKFISANVSSILQNVYTRFTPLARQQGLDITIELPNNDVYAAVDHEALIKILSNLFTNAIKYADTYVHALLVVDEETNNFRVAVSNDGNIIPADMREEIFKPFVQYRENEKELKVGTGIGLSLARSLAELHNGTLSMDDTYDRNRFVLIVPKGQVEVVQTVETEETEDPDMIEASSIKNPKQRNPAVLIVEDDPAMLSYISRQLSSTYHILTAVNGLEALQILNDNNVKIVVSDVMMAQMDGLELCNRIKSDIEYSHIPVILLTAKTNIQAKIDGMNSGADIYVEKPFSMEYLKACISNLLSNREKLRNAFTNSPFTSANSMAMTKADENFLKTLSEVVAANMQDPDFCLDDMANILNMSRSTLNRKIKGILDMTPNDYIRLERLKKAAELLKEGECKVNEICYTVGFNTPSYFTKCFQKQFGALPKDFVKK